MRKIIPLLATYLLIIVGLHAQVESAAGEWKTWFIKSAKDHRLPQPGNYKNEIAQVIAAQNKLDSAGRVQMIFWNAGAPGYRWHEMLNKLWQIDTSYKGVLANMLLGTGIYDATIAAWDSKYTHKRPRPFIADSRIKSYIPKPESPSFPCEYSVAAGVATTIIGHFYPSLKDSANRMAEKMMASRIAAGVAFPSDTYAGFELGKQIAAIEIEQTKNFVNTIAWDQKMPQQPGTWKGKSPMFVLAARNKTIVLDSSSQFRPAPPPDFTKEMAELKNFKQTFRSTANAFHYAAQPVWEDMLNKKLFEYNLHLNPPRAARIYAVTAVATYDCFAACWDAKYAYWGIRPDQLDTTYRPILLHTPPFPGYPSGHATMSGMMAELNSYFFPAEKSYFQRKAKEGAESRFQAGIHFRTDNEVGLELGRKVTVAVIEKIKNDGADQHMKSQ